MNDEPDKLVVEVNESTPESAAYAKWKRAARAAQAAYVALVTAKRAEAEAYAELGNLVAPPPPATS